MFLWVHVLRSVLRSLLRYLSLLLYVVGRQDGRVRCPRELNCCHCSFDSELADAVTMNDKHHSLELPCL